MSTIKIAIADDYKIFREGIKVGLASDENIKVILEADNGEDLITGMEENRPEVILMDLKMPIMDGMEATRVIRKKYNSVKILVVTMYDDDKFIIHLMENGANGYLLKMPSRMRSSKPYIQFMRMDTISTISLTRLY